MTPGGRAHWAPGICSPLSPLWGGAEGLSQPFPPGSLCRDLNSRQLGLWFSSLLSTRPPGSSTSSPTVPVTRDPERCLLLLSPISPRELGAETSDCYTAYHSLCTKFKNRHNSCAVRNPSSNHLLAGEGIAWKGARRGLSMVLKRPRAELSNWYLWATLYVLKSELNK